ncbi:MAG: LptA/OstA family protein [Rhodobacteraceae bacterium]|jgi:lipopolysaccharide export system protein LptA|nr:LptA/OstA family protein [Paracoccaceae bacterium]
MGIRPVTLIAAALVAALPLSGLAQGTGVDFGGLRQDTSLPVEVNADELSVDQADGAAVFSGNVSVAQGDMRLSAGAVRVIYGAAADGANRIDRLEATGGVTLVAGADAAESREAIYTVDSGVIVMTGDVLLTQGRSTITSQKLTVNLTEGRGVLEGGVRTIFQPGGQP